MNRHSTIMQWGARLVLAAGLVLGGGVQAQTHTLNLQDAEIQVLVATVAEITGRSFIIDPSVTGRVTVISSQPMDEDQVYRVFLSVLQVNGLAAVPGEDAIKIVPDTAALQSASVAGGPEDIVTRVIGVASVPPSELLPVLRPLVPAQSQVVALDSAGALVVSDRAANVERIAALVQRIDRRSEEPVEVMPLENANAAELARTLNLLYPSASGVNTVIADERTNTLLLGGDPSARMKMRALVSHLDLPTEGGGDTRVVYLHYARAEELVPILERTLASLEGAGEEGSRSAIQAHEETNALVITAPSALARNLQAVIRQLDIRREQVLVEAIIAEVAAQTVRELGVQWQLTDSLEDGDGAFGGTNFGGRGSGVNILDLSLNPAGAASGLNLGYLSGTTEILGEDFFQIGFLVRALEQDGDTNILSTPSLVMLDNQEAVIFVGEEIPFVTGQFTNTGANEGAVNPFQTIQRTEVGLRLTVTPHINEGDSVVLDIQQEVSSLSRTQVAVDLITRKREVATSVMVPDNTVLVLAGLVSDDLAENVEAVPGLSRIPGLGRLFKYENTTAIKRNLVVFIRPRILRDMDDEFAVSSAKYNRLRAEQLKARENSDTLVPPGEMPLLPELFDYLQTAPSEGAGER